MKTKSLKSLILIICAFTLICGIFSVTSFQSSAYASNNTPNEETVTMKGKVQGPDGAVAASPKFFYERSDGYTATFYGDIWGGFFFAMPADYDCTITVYCAGYYPSNPTPFTSAELISEKPVYDLGTITLAPYEWLSTSGTVYSEDDNSVVAGAKVTFNFGFKYSEISSVNTTEDGAFSVQVPKNIEGYWTIEKLGYYTITTEPITYSTDVTGLNFTIEKIILDVVFNSNGGSFVDPQQVKYGDLVEVPDDPTLESNNFAGWYTDNSTFQNQYDFNAPVTDHLTLYAKWNQVISPEDINTSSQNTQTGDNMLPLIGISLTLLCLSLILFCKKNFKNDN